MAAADTINSTTKSLFVTLARHSLHEWRRTGRLPDDIVRLFRSQTDLHPTQQTDVGHIMVHMWLRFQFDHVVELQDEIMLHLIRYFEDNQVHIGAVTEAFDVGVFPTLAFFPESNLERNLPKLHRLLGEEVMRRIYEHRSIRFEELHEMFRRFPPLKESVSQAVGRVLQSKTEDEWRCVDVIDPFSLPGDNIARTNNGEPRTNVREVAEKLRHPARTFQNKRTECQREFGVLSGGYMDYMVGKGPGPGHWFFEWASVTNTTTSKNLMRMATVLNNPRCAGTANIATDRLSNSAVP